MEYLQCPSEHDLGRSINTPWGATFPLVDVLGHWIGHEVHHRAELSPMLGMLGREGLKA